MTLGDFMTTAKFPHSIDVVINGLDGDDIRFVSIDEEVTNWTIVKNTVVIFTTLSIEEDSFDDDGVIPVDLDKVIG